MYPMVLPLYSKLARPWLKYDNSYSTRYLVRDLLVGDD